MSDAYWEYIKLIVLKAKFTSNGLENSSRMTGLQEEMDDHWFEMTSEEKEKVKGFRDELFRLVEVQRCGSTS